MPTKAEIAAYLRELENPPTEQDFRAAVEVAVTRELNRFVEGRRRRRQELIETGIRNVLDEFGARWAASPIADDAVERFEDAQDARAGGVHPAWRMWGCMTVLWDSSAEPLKRLSAAAQLEAEAFQLQDPLIVAAYDVQKIVYRDCQPNDTDQDDTGAARKITYADIGDALQIGEDGASKRYKRFKATLAASSTEAEGMSRAPKRRSHRSKNV